MKAVFNGQKSDMVAGFEQMWDEIIGECDKDGDGEIDFDEF
jgi:Ca2+-binding EF-hand superfamily protein